MQVRPCFPALGGLRPVSPATPVRGMRCTRHPVLIAPPHTAAVTLVGTPCRTRNAHAARAKLWKWEWSARVALGSIAVGCQMLPFSRTHSFHASGARMRKSASRAMLVRVAGVCRSPRPQTSRTREHRSRRDARPAREGAHSPAAACTGRRCCRARRRRRKDRAAGAGVECWHQSTCPAEHRDAG